LDLVTSDAFLPHSEKGAQQKVHEWRGVQMGCLAPYVPRHNSGLARELVPLAENCLRMPVAVRFTPAGALPVTTAQGIKVLPDNCLC